MTMPESIVISSEHNLAWLEWEREWAIRWIAKYDDRSLERSPDDQQLVFGIADDARLAVATPVRLGRVPNWFRTRLEPEFGRGALWRAQLNNYFRCDHWGSTLVREHGDVFVTEPHYEASCHTASGCEWCRVHGCIRRCSWLEPLERANELAARLKCGLIVDRIAHWHLECYRLTLVPNPVQTTGSRPMRCNFTHKNT